MSEPREMTEEERKYALRLLVAYGNVEKQDGDYLVLVDGRRVEVDWENATFTQRTDDDTLYIDMKVSAKFGRKQLKVVTLDGYSRQDQGFAG